ncbi:MAG: hypothetical protein IPK67_04280 [Planctomycetes bacterium]|nr:hypothetical protein [Planctomycetota bacterium]
MSLVREVAPVPQLPPTTTSATPDEKPKSTSAFPTASEIVRDPRFNPNSVQLTEDDIAELQGVLDVLANDLLEPMEEFNTATKEHGRKLMAKGQYTEYSANQRVQTEIGFSSYFEGDSAGGRFVQFDPKTVPEVAKFLLAYQAKEHGIGAAVQDFLKAKQKAGGGG